MVESEFADDSWEDFFGTTSTLLVLLMAPLDRVKLLLQVQASSPQIPEHRSYKGIIDALRRISKEQGYASFWRGSLGNVIRVFPTVSFSFTWKYFWQELFTTEVDRNTQFWRYFFGHLAAGGLAGAVSSPFFYPFEYAYTLVASDIGRDESTRQYRGLMHCFIKTINSEGVFGMYKGFLTSVQGIIIYRAAYFGFYDVGKDILIDPEKPSVKVSFLIAQTVTTVAGLLAYPFDTVRRRKMMIQKQQIVYRNLWIEIASQEGFRAFYKGAFSNIINGTGSALMLVIFDEARRIL